MTAQEAIEQLNSLIRDRQSFIDDEEHDSIYISDIEALNIAQKALEKQIPKKPLDVCTPVITWGLCPVCKGELNKLGNKVNHVFKSNAFCPDCGQALDWSDEND